MNNTWKLETFSAEKINENIEKKIFTIPRYQRGIVWTQRQKDTLVDTIKKVYLLVHYYYITAMMVRVLVIK